LLDGEPKRPVDPELVGHFQNMRGGREQRDNGDDESEKAKSLHEQHVGAFATRTTRVMKRF